MRPALSTDLMACGHRECEGNLHGSGTQAFFPPATKSPPRSSAPSADVISNSLADSVQIGFALRKGAPMSLETVTREPSRVHRSTIIVLGGLLLVLLVARWWFQTPTGGASSFRALNTAGPIHCSVTHDGLLYFNHEDSVVLEPGGNPFTGRFGPHDVTLAYRDEGEGLGLTADVATRSLGWTSGSSSGHGDHVLDVTTGPGLGTVVIRCDPMG